MATVSSPASAAEDSFDDYHVICEIGRGGMGIVYFAEQTEPVRREVAIKALKPGLDEHGILSRFETERHVLALMTHPNIATLHSAGTSRRGRPYFVMEFVDGLPITEACDRRRCSIRQRIALFSEVCHAIDHAHRKGVLHRDIKPSNVLITERDGRLVPKVIDFGIARAIGHLTGDTMATAYGELLGTPEYMSPEQASFGNAAIVPASDVYSLGVLLYELVAGVLPFDAARLRQAGILEATRIVREEEAPDPAKRLTQTGKIQEVAAHRAITSEALQEALTGDLTRILRTCLQKDPLVRYVSPALLADDIDRYLRGETVLAPSVPRGRRATHWMHRYRFAIIAAVAIAIAMVAALRVFVPALDRQAHVAFDVTQLTAYRGAESCPSFSPDARDIAFTWNGSDESNWDIYRLHIGDTVPRRLTSDPAAQYGPAWSPDGKWIAFLEAVTDVSAYVMVMPAQGGAKHEIVLAQLNVEPRKRRIAWSPDSKWLLLAYRRPGMAHQRVFAISLATKEERQLSDLENALSDADGQPAISRDGRWLFFARDASSSGELWRMPLTQEMRPAGIEQRIEMANMEGRECSVPTPISDKELLFIAPSRAITVMLWRGSTSAHSPVKPLAELGDYAMAPTLSPDGTKLAFAREMHDTNVWRLELDAPHGKELKRELVEDSTRWDQNPALSPDGTHLAFESNRGGTLQIWVAAADGSDTKQLTNVERSASSARWSPDGREIAFQVFKNAKPDVFVIPSTGGSVRQLTFDPSEDQQPVWSPDGKWIYFCSLRSGSRELWRVPPQGGNPTRVTQHGGFDVSFSPDGRWLYYSRVRAPSTSIWRMSIDGNDDRMIVDGVIGGHVAVTGGGLYFASGFPGQKKCRIQYLDLATRHIKTLAATDRKVQDRLAVSPDERTVYYTQLDDDGMDLMLVSNFR